MHSHPQFPAYDGDRDAVLRRLRDSGTGVIAVGTQFSTSEAALALADAYPDFVWATVGFHPGHLRDDWHHDVNEQGGSEPEVFDREKLRVLLRHPKAVAVGECGLDYFVRKDQSPIGDEEKKRQGDVLRAQMELASEEGKPLMIHCRSAFPDLLKMLTTHRELLRSSDPGVIHFFSGTPDEVEQLLNLGFSFTFGGVITFVHDYDKVIANIPLEKLLAETDAPYVTPAPHRGKRNEPVYVSFVLSRLAELKDTSVEVMREETLSNARRIFGI